MGRGTQVGKKDRRSVGYFVTGTGTDVGKTVVTAAFGVMLQGKGIDVGVMKPVQCSGEDAVFLKKCLKLRDPLSSINPFFAKEPLSPNVAFARQKTRIQPARIMQEYARLKNDHDLMLVEGAGGLLVPITDRYLMADLAKDLDLELIIVASLGLGTINHTLLTIQNARQMGLRIKGVVFNQLTSGKKGVPERTNPEIVGKLGKVPILGTLPHLPRIDRKEILKKCKGQLDTLSLVQKTWTKSPRALKQWDKEYVWHPFTQMKDWNQEEPLVIDSARGVYLKDVDGNRYLDGVSSLWVNLHGHDHKHINQAVLEQLGKLDHSTLLGLSNTPSIKLAKELVEISPRGLRKVFYSDSGSTAVEIALKISYQYWQNIGKRKKTDIVHFANSYHGDTLGSVSVGGIDLFHKVYRKLIFKTICVDFPDCYRAPRGKKYPQYAFENLKKLGRLFKSSHQKIASLIVEPIVQGAAGMIVWPKGVLKEIERLCRKHNILLILDEVATGFGRTGKMFACQHEGVNPDILCLAKGLTGGYLPLAATLTTDKIYDGFLFDYKDQKTFFHGHTYTGNPLCCAAALANLKIFEKERTLQKLQPKIKFLRTHLRRFSGLEHVGDIRQKGFMVGIELVIDKRTKKAYPWEEKIGVQVCREARKKGVILRPLGNVIVLMPPLSIMQKELQYLLDATYGAIKTVTGP